MKHQWHKKIIILIAALIVAVPAITYAASERKDKNTVKYNAVNEPIEGTKYQAPTRDGYLFDGWNTKEDGSGTGVTPSEAANPTLSSSFYNNVTNGETKKLYAQWRQGTPAKYAVAIYGINADGDKTITFGPAIDRYGYILEEKSPHISLSEETDEEKCIHNHTWSEIIEQIKKNPNVFNTCIEKGCTKTVDLAINKDLIGPNWNKDKYDQEKGDGPSLLHFEIKGEYRIWQPWKNDSESITSNNWASSRLRAVLNGYDSKCNYEDSKQRYLYLGDDDTAYVYTWKFMDLSDIKKINGSNCLLSCFPSELQRAIKEKAVTSGDVVTHDKLWLFDVDDINHLLENSNESNYTKKVDPEFGLIAYAFNEKGASEKRQNYNWWLCTKNIKTVKGGYANVVSTNRIYFQPTNQGNSGIAPGFVVG